MKNTLHQRFRDYLAKFPVVVDDNEWTSRRHLQQLAEKNGYSREAIREAYQLLMDDPDTSIVWNKGKRDEVVCWFPLSDEEKAKVLADREWFDSL